MWCESLFSCSGRLDHLLFHGCAWRGEALRFAAASINTRPHHVPCLVATPSEIGIAAFLFALFLLFFLAWAMPGWGGRMRRCCCCEAWKYRRKLRSMPPGVYHQAVGMDVGNYSIKVHSAPCVVACARTPCTPLTSFWCLLQVGWFQVNDGRLGSSASQTLTTSLVATWADAMGRHRRHAAVGQRALDQVRKRAKRTKVYYCLKRLLMHW